MVESLLVTIGHRPRQRDLHDLDENVGTFRYRLVMHRRRQACVAGSICLAIVAFSFPLQSMRAAEVTANCDESPICRERFSQAQQFAKEEELEKSLAILQPLCATYPDPRLTYPLARLLHRLKRPIDAIPLYQRYLDAGIESNPEVLARVRQFQREAQIEAELDRRVYSTSLTDAAGKHPPPPASKVKPWVWVVVGVAGLAAVGTAVGVGVYFGTGVPTPDATVMYR